MPQEKRLLFGLELEHFHLCWRGDRKENPLKVNISRFMSVFLEFIDYMLSLSLENPKALLWMTALTPGYGFPFGKASTIDGI